MKLPNSLKHASFLFDFAVDGGAIGINNMGDFIADNNIIIVGHIKVLQTLVYDPFIPIPNISVGFTGSNQILVNDTPASSFVTNAIIPGVDLLRFPVGVETTVQLTMSIKLAALFSGKFVYFCSYMENSGADIAPFPPVGLRGISVDIISTTLHVYP